MNFRIHSYFTLLCWNCFLILIIELFYTFKKAQVVRFLIVSFSTFTNLQFDIGESGAQYGFYF